MKCNNIVKKITWNRVFLTFEIESETKGSVFFIGRKQSEKIEIPYEKYDAGTYFFNLNICQMNGRNFLDNGRWNIYDSNDEKVFATLNVAESFESLTRIFRYSDKDAYCIYFDVNSGENEEFTDFLPFAIESRFMSDNNKWYDREKNIKGKLLKISSTLYDCFSNSKKEKKNVLFFSQTKDEISGNLKAISDRIKERKLDKEFKISYYFNKDVGVKKDLLKYMKLALLVAKQDYIFIEDYVPFFSVFNPPKRCKLIQLWHAGVGFKAVGYCRFGKIGSPHPVQSYHRKYTKGIASSDASIDVFREVFAIEKENFIHCGMPRLDDFLNEDKIKRFKEKFYKQYPNLENKKIILFAPTYRGSGQQFAHYDYNLIDNEAVKEMCGDEYVFMVKMHPFIKEKIQIPNDMKDVILDFNDYDNINELYYITDILITDYSSNFYEFSLFEKPVIFFTYDRRVYQLTRGVHKDVKDSAPGKVCDTFKEVMQAIENKDFEIEKIKKFKEDYLGTGINKENSSDIVIDNILLNGGKL